MMDGRDKGLSGQLSRPSSELKDLWQTVDIYGAIMIVHICCRKEGMAAALIGLEPILSRLVEVNLSSMILRLAVSDNASVT